MKRYQVRPNPKEIPNSLLHYPFLSQKLFLQRGIFDTEKVLEFLSPRYEDGLHDPFLLKDMDKAVARIMEAISKKEKILIYSDYDADGIPGGVMLREFFEKIGHNTIDNYIPHRHDEGYGLHLEAIEIFKESGVSLIITIDCGIVDVLQVARAKELGIDVIITDHHEPGEVLPDAFAILNHKQKDCLYPEKILCGTGVAFKLIQALLSKERFGLKEGQEKWFLDLVGIATLSDMVPLVGENRVLAFYGLKVLQKSPRLGLSELWKKLRVNQKLLREDDVTFSLTPRLNAASRMGHPMDGFRLLYTRDPIVATETALYLNKINDERKGLVAVIVKDIRKRLREMDLLGPLPGVLVFGNPLWKPALLGLVANSILDEVKRPIFLWGRNGDKDIKGSCRSPGDVDLIELMRNAEDVFLQFGGHKMAGGFAISHDNIHLLEERLSMALSKKESSLEEDVMWVDAELELSQVSWELFHTLEKFSPFGILNERPLFLIKGVTIEDARSFGKEKNHADFKFSDGRVFIKGIKFFSKPESFTVGIPIGSRCRVVGTLEKNIFGSNRELRLRIIDIIPENG